MELLKSATDSQIQDSGLHFQLTLTCFKTDLGLCTKLFTIVGWLKKLVKQWNMHAVGQQYTERAVPTIQLLLKYLQSMNTYFILTVCIVLCKTRFRFPTMGRTGVRNFQHNKATHLRQVMSNQASMWIRQ